MSAQCPGPGSWQAYIDDEVEVTQTVAMEAHLRQCPACNQLLESMVKENRLLTQLFGSENEALNLRVVWERKSFGDIGITWGWIGGGFLALSVLITLISSYLTNDISLISWLRGFSPQLVFTVAVQQLLADGWRLFIDTGTQLLSVSDLMTRLSLITSLVSAGIGLIAMRLISKLIVWQEEVFLG